MTKDELKKLHELLSKLRAERTREYEADYEDFNLWTSEEQYDYDDGDNLLQGIDIVLTVVEDMNQQ